MNIKCLLFGHDPVWHLNPKKESFIYCKSCGKRYGYKVPPIKLHSQKRNDTGE